MPVAGEPDDPVPSVEALEPEIVSLPPPAPPPTEDWLPPVVGHITDVFGPRDDGTFHDAVDLRAALGSEVAAPTEMRIAYIGYRTKAGRFIIADSADGKYELTFAHLSHVEVVEGQRVSRGELLGLTGISGSVTGPHLHFRVERIDDDGARTAVDPLTVFSASKITGE